MTKKTNKKVPTRFDILKATTKQLQKSEKEVAAYLAKEVHSELRKQTEKVKKPTEVKPTIAKSMISKSTKAKPMNTKPTEKKQKKSKREIDLTDEDSGLYLPAKKRMQDFLDELYEYHLTNYNQSRKQKLDPEETETDESEDEQDQDAFATYLVDAIDEALAEYKMDPGKTYLTKLAEDIFLEEDYDSSFREKTVKRWMDTLDTVAEEKREKKFNQCHCFSEKEDEFYNKLQEIFHEHNNINVIANEIRKLKSQNSDVKIDEGILRFMAQRKKLNYKVLKAELQKDI